MNKFFAVIKSYKQQFTIVILLILLILFFSVSTSGFAKANNFFNLLRQIAVLGILSTGMTAVIISGSIDLSVGSQVSLVSVVTAKLIVEIGVSPVLACVAGILTAIMVGMLNGLIIVTTDMTPMICTLAMMQVLQGIAYTLTNALPVYGIPNSMKLLGQGYLGYIPVPVILMAFIFVIGAFLLKKTYIGRYLYAVGSNAEASRLSGLNVKMVKLIACAFSGLLAGIAGIVMTSRISSGQPTSGSGMEMDVITACVVGGVSLSGGRGSMFGVIIGVLIMGVLSNGFGVMGVSMYNQMICKGLILALVVGIDGLQQIYGSKGKKSPIAE